MNTKNTKIDIKNDNTLLRILFVLLCLGVLSLFFISYTQGASGDGKANSTGIYNDTVRFELNTGTAISMYTTTNYQETILWQ